MKNLNTTIRVKGVSWKLKTKKNLSDPTDGIAVMGYCDPRNKAIFIDSDLNYPEFVETVLHEYMHAIWFELGLDDEHIPKWVEHMFINGISKDMIVNSSFLARLLYRA